MKTITKFFCAAGLAQALLSCSSPESETAVAADTQIATLYRNGSLLKSMRIQFATFDAPGEANDFNISNCQMAARLLNQNIRAQTPESDEQSVGFWCEPGAFREDGFAPDEFAAEFPTEVTAKAAP